MPAFKDHFSTHAVGYAAHRPSYPAALVDYLVGISPALDLALDCGCGTGQLSALLANRFERVVATDASAEQIAQARPHPRIGYHMATAGCSGLPDRSADLITVAQAAHWLDLDAFYAEARRVARPGAGLALIAYGFPKVAGEVGELVTHFYADTLDAHWPPERRHIETGYRSLAFPFAELNVPALVIERDWLLDDLIGYLDTWSAVRALEKDVGRGPFEAMLFRLAEAWGDPGMPRRMTWPLAIRAARL